MKIIEPSYIIETDISEGGIEELKTLEEVGRICYKSEDKITADSAKDFVKRIVDRGHTSILDHGFLRVRFICDRGFSHELVRHRIASYAQESTRYCNYSKDKFDNQITVIRPIGIEPEYICFFADKYKYSEVGTGSADYFWTKACEESEKRYFKLLKLGVTPEVARSVLPTCLKTEIVITASYTEWRHILKLRTSNAAHPEMRRLMRPLLKELQKRLPIIFDDIEVE